MSERIDHVAEAQEWIDAAMKYPGATGTAVLAAAEAILALVEQQRIANLIALGMLQVTAGMDPNGGPVGDGAAFRALYPDGPTTPPAPDIAAALGIEVSE